ncbi:MAG: FkbM family methyltransferase [Sphingobacteriales bacterium]|nr:FkbM family methyltransferase [Sphingobacteriales bacterium]
MIRALKRKIRFLLGAKNDTNYYSQGGEDAIIIKAIRDLMRGKKGFYMDIGAYHPFHHSNTYILYTAGWRGINIEPQPGSKKLFDRYRKGDINIEAGIADKDGELTYYIIDDKSTMNTFSLENLKKLGMDNQVRRTLKIPVFTVDSLLAKYPQIKEIDYLNIDAEGYEMEVLGQMKSIVPKIISIEQNDIFTLDDVYKTNVYKFLSQKGYKPFAKNLILKNVATVFYVSEDIAEGANTI